MARYTPNSASTISEVNQEFEKIEQAIDDSLSRKGSDSNSMERPLDMNSERIINLPEAVSAKEPCTFGQFQSGIEYSKLPKDAEVLDSLVALSDIDTSKVKNVWIKGFYPNSTVGGGWFTLKSVDLDSNNGGTVISVEAVKAWKDAAISSGGVTTTNLQSNLDVLFTPGAGTGDAFVRLTQEYVDPFWFGCVNSDTTSSHLALEQCGKVSVSEDIAIYSDNSGEIYLSQKADMFQVYQMEVRFNIKTATNTGPYLEFGGKSQSAGGYIKLKDVTDGSSLVSGPAPSSPLILVGGLKSVNFEYGSCNYIKFFPEQSRPTNNSFAYSTIRSSGPTFKFEVTDDGGFSWFNENRVYGGRIKELSIVEVGYPHNHNKFYDSVFEGAEVDVKIGGNHNYVLGARFEGVSTSSGITFLAGSFCNTVQATHGVAGNARTDYYVNIPVADNGQHNQLTTYALENRDRNVVLNFDSSVTTLSYNGTHSTSECPYVSPKDVNISNLTAPTILTPEILGFDPQLGTRYSILSDFIDVSKEQVLVFDIDADASTQYYLHIACFDENKKQLVDNSGGDFLSQAGQTFANGVYQCIVTPDQMRLSPSAVISDQVRYVRVGLSRGTGKIIKRFTIACYSDNRGYSPNQQKSSVMTLPQKPDKGYAKLGQTVWLSDAVAYTTCIFSYYSYTSGEVSSGGTSVTVDNATGVSNGDVVGLLMDNGFTHWTSVSALSSNTFTIDAVPTGRSIPDGSICVFNRWS